MRGGGMKQRPMAVWLGLGLGVFGVLLLTRPIWAADISGTWEVSYWYGDSVQSFTLEITQDGSRISGAGVARLHSGRDTVSVSVTGETFAGRDFRLRVVAISGTEVRAQDFVGGWFQDQMSGRTEGDLGTRMFRGTRRWTE